MDVKLVYSCMTTGSINVNQTELVELKLLHLSHFLQNSVIILVIFGTEGLHFAQRGSVFIMDTIILDILTKWSVMYFLGTNHAEG